MERKVIKKVKGFRTVDGAGVNLVRVLGGETIKDFDPILMLDSFDSSNYEDYKAGFPMHPHRGIETISYVYRGKMLHSDSLGFKDEVSDEGVQWMTAGSGIMHEERLPKSDSLFGVQLWLNLPAKYKMVDPSYKNIKKEEIQEIEFDGGFLRLLAGNYKDFNGYQAKYLPFDYYDIHLNSNSSIKIDTKVEKSVMIFTLKGEVYINGELIEEKTAVKVSEGEYLELVSKDKEAQVLFMSSDKLNEPVAWNGPIVMNTSHEIWQAISDLQHNTFVKKDINII